MRIVKCDKCQEEFSLVVKEKELKDKISKVYFNCTSCGEEYIIHYTNVLVKQKQKRLRDLTKKHKELRGKRDLRGSNKIYKRYKKTQKETKAIMRKLERKIVGGY